MITIAHTIPHALAIANGTPFTELDASLGTCISLHDTSVASSLFQDSGLTTPAVSGDPCGGWRDISGNNNHILQAGAGTAKPTVTSANFGGRVSLAFDGGDSLTKATFTQGAQAQPITIYVVCFRSAGTYFIDGGAAGTRNYFLFTSGTAGQFAADTALAWSGGTNTANPHVYCFVVDATDVLYQDGVQRGTGNAGAVAMNGLTVGKNVGAAVFGTGGVALVGIYAGAHNASQRNAMNALQISKWGIS